MNKNAAWVPFWFESNAAWGMVTDSDAWEEIRKNYAKSHPNDDPTLIYTATSTKNSGRNGCNYNFGFRLEHIGGKQTLRDFFEKNWMPLTLLQEPPEGCQEITGVILIVEPSKSWLTATGEITEVWQERGVWTTEEDANRFKDQLFGE